MGRAGSGKTTAILRRIAAQKTSGKRQILIVPELASHEYERMLAEITQNTGSRFAEVLTFRRIANRVFSEAGGLSDTMLTPAGRLLVLYEAARRASDALTLYASAARKPDILRDLLHVLDEMKCSCISAEDLLRAAEEADGHLADKLHDLGEISMIYDVLTEEQLPDPRDQLTRVAERLSESTLFDDAEVYFDRFDSFNKQELEILAYLLKKKIPVTVALTGDPSRPELFPETHTVMARLRALAGRYGDSFELTIQKDSRMPRPADLAILEQYALEAPVKQFQSDGESVRLHAAGDLFSECEFAAAYIRRLLRETDARRRDIVVTARNFEQYAPILELVFDRYDIPVFLSEKHDILQKPVLTLVEAALRTVTDGWRYEDMFSYLKTGFAGLTADECDELENYVLFWRIRGMAWQRPFAGSPDGFGGVLDETAQQMLDHLNQLRERVVQPLVALKQGLDAAETATQYVQALYIFLEQLGAADSIAARAQLHEDAGRLQTAEEYRQLWEILIQAMEQFAWVQGDGLMETDTFVSLFALVLAEYDVGVIPVALDRVTCGSIDRVCHTGIPHLIVLGVNDGILPDACENSGILSDRDREILLGLSVELETGEDRMMREQTAVYRVFASASKTLLLSWCTVGGEGDMRPSYLIGTVRHLLYGVPETDERALGQSYRLEAERPRFDLACRGAARDISPAAQAAFAISPVPIVPQEKSVRGPLTKTDTVHALYGHRLRVTASRMDAFYRCEYAYFLRYGLRAKERRRAAFDAPETGTFLHYVLEHTLYDLREQGGLDALTRSAVHDIAKKWTQTYVETMLGDLEQHSARFRHLFRRLVRMLDEILDNLLDEMEHSDFEPIDFELDFSHGGDLPPIVIDSSDGKLEMNGKVDRVDGYIKDGTLYVRVMDYKSGQKKFELSDLWYGLNVQLLLYLFAIQKQGLGRYRAKLAQQIDEIVPAGALYIPARSVLVNAPRGTDDETLEQLRRKQLRRSGLILDDPAVIEAMEHGVKKDGEFVPIGYLKNGNVSAASLSSLASLEQLGKLSEHIRHILHSMGHALMQGKMDAHPVRRGPTEDVCTWCPYRAVCRFDTKMGDKPHNIAKMKPEEFWQSIDRELEGGNGHGGSLDAGTTDGNC